MPSTLPPARGLRGQATMQRTSNPSRDAAVISDGEPVCTQAHTNRRARSLAFGACALLAPVALGAEVAAVTRSRRAGLFAAIASAAGFAALRWQMARWFVDQPAYVVEDPIGDLEVRRYAPRVEAQTRLTVLDFEIALDEGFRRLAAYIFGGNQSATKLAMTSPVTNVPRARTHTVAFVMPPDRTLSSLPPPEDARVALVPVPARRIAALRYRGRYTGAHMMEQTRRLHELVAAADLEPRGQPIFAGYDPPWTLPWLRRAEIWVELA